MVILATVFLVGPVVTTLSSVDYLKDQNTLAYLNNVFLYGMSPNLPGVFAGNAFPNAVNGSLWTLAYEFTMYLAIAAIGVFRIYKKIPITYVWVALLIGNIFQSTILGRPIDVVLFTFRIGDFLPLAFLFFTGVLVHEKFNPSRFHAGRGLLSIIVFVGMSVLVPRVAIPLGSILLAYGVFAIGAKPYFSSFQKIGDFSYGIYIYSWLIQQVIVWATQTSSPLKLFTLSLFLSIICGILSWHLIEKRALSWKQKIKLGRYPLDTVDEAW